MLEVVNRGAGSCGWFKAEATERVNTGKAVAATGNLTSTFGRSVGGEDPTGNLPPTSDRIAMADGPGFGPE